jgi:hypothetical protein
MAQVITQGSSVLYMPDSDEMVLDCPKHSVMVIDADCQGLLELTTIGRRLKHEFPNTYKAYQASLVAGAKVAGDILLVEERKHKIALLYTTNYKLGKCKDEEQTVIKFTKSCIEKLIESCGTEILYSSGILNRHTKTWPYISPWLLEKKLYWYVYRS